MIPLLAETPSPVSFLPWKETPENISLCKPLLSFIISSFWTNTHTHIDFISILPLIFYNCLLFYFSLPPSLDIFEFFPFCFIFWIILCSEITVPERKEQQQQKYPLLCKAQHEWESCHCTVCPCSILASYNFLHNCLNVLILIPVALPTLCYFLKKASKLHVWFNGEFHRGKNARLHHMPWVTLQHLRKNIMHGDGSPPVSAASGDLPSLPAASGPGMWEFLMCLCHSIPKYHITKNIKIKLLITFSWMPSGPHWKLTLSVKLKITTFSPALYVLMFVIMDFTLMPQLHWWHSFNRVALMTFIIIYAPP